MNKNVILNFVEQIKLGILSFLKEHREPICKPTYRVMRIEKTDNDEYEAVIQVIGRASIFKSKPEDILISDEMTNHFSPTDIRALTYLGYLEINSPKYKILAQRLSKNDSKIVFAIQKRGSKEVAIKTAKEISRDSEIISSIAQQDAHAVGYASATEDMLKEAMEKKKLEENIVDVS